jgi:hypothetical protein
MRLFEEVSRSEEELAPTHEWYRQRAARLDDAEGRRTEPGKGGGELADGRRRVTVRM